ncbi:MAG: MobA/MobL family protein [Chloroflexota bacterium]|nr:MobA/MobL family protein [Chloroflexota bacterium]
MAIYHLSAQVIGRSSGRSAVAAAAYRSGSELHDERTDLYHDYSRRCDIDSWIQAPEHAPSWVSDRQDLWNRVEASERRCDSQVARELNVALPEELDRGR